MKPPYLKKFTKKQLKKEYTRQWREAIRANGEIYKANRVNDQLHELVHQQAEEINVKSILLTEHFAEIQNLKQLLDHERKERTRVELQAVDLEEALSRSRQLRNTYQELAERKVWEKATIEEMAKNLHQFAHDHEVWAFDLLKRGHYINNPTLKVWPIPKWESLSEDRKDHFRVQATHIISHKPTDGKPEGTTLDEGSPQ